MTFKTILLSCLTWASTLLWAQDPKAYALFDAQGKSVSYTHLINQLSKADVVFLGEMHNCPITHWMESLIVASLHERHGKQLVIGAEMFEADNQLILDEFLQRRISGKRFEEECRLWPNYSTDYSPIVMLAYEHRIPVVATNIPRRYATAVKDKGWVALDSLTDEARRYIAPLPIPLTNATDSVAQAAFAEMAGMMGHRKDQYFVEAQAIKDATMAWHIAQRPTAKWVHLNGSYHTDAGGGILPYLKHYRPELKTMVLTALKQEQVERLEEGQLGRSDFYLCVPDNMTTSY